VHPAAAQPDGVSRKARAALGIALVAAGLICGAAAHADTVPCLIATAPTGDRPIVWDGRFDEAQARARREIDVCVHLAAPRALRITIDGPGLSTIGHVRFPDGHQEGAPGGPFFDEMVAAGNYQIIVGQRWPEWKRGRFRIVLVVR
jgi:hypothetical protein